MATQVGGWRRFWQVLERDDFDRAEKELAFEFLLRYRGTADDPPWWGADLTLSESTRAHSRAIAWAIVQEWGVPLDRIEYEGAAALALMELPEQAWTIYGPPMSWLRGVLRHILLDDLIHQRKRATLDASSPEKLEVVPDPHADCVEGLEGEEVEHDLQEAARQQQVIDAIGRLTAKLREVAEPYFTQNTSVAEIARALGIKLNTTQKRLARAIEKIKEATDGSAS